ncbi:hypothetical protein COOONC_07586 [Cooperia oncophora]
MILIHSCPTGDASARQDRQQYHLVRLLENKTYSNAEGDGQGPKCVYLGIKVPWSTTHLSNLQHGEILIEISTEVRKVYGKEQKCQIVLITFQAVPYLGPLEYFLNTPSSHRVHHGRNPYCIDRNYGGTLIIWDRLFGTYEPERKDEEIAYGLVTPVASFNQLWCQFFEFKALGYDKGQMRNEKNEEVFPGVWNKVKAALWPPGYFPGVRTKPFFLWLCMYDNTEGIPEIEHPVVPYNPPLMGSLRCYLFAQWLLIIVGFLQFDKLRVFLSWPEFLCRVGFLIAYIQMFGYYFDHSRFSVIYDSTRLVFTILLGWFLKDSSMVIYSLASLAIISWLASAGKISSTVKITEKNTK